MEPGSDDPTGPGYALENLAALIGSNLNSAEQVVENRDEYVRAFSFPSYKYDVCFGYSQQDKVAVHRLANRLRADGLQIWLDDWVLRPGDNIYLSSNE